MIQGIHRPLAVVAHDAGAASHIFAWLDGEQPAMCLAGPAHALWEARHGQLAQSDLEAALSGAATVITGTGWASNLEHDARRLARSSGATSIAVIDHWTNYADRFVRNGVQVLPDEIWVSDPHAKEIAQAVFPTVRVVQQANAYLAGLVAEVESRQLPAAAEGNDRVLYVLEPIRHMWGKLDEQGEFLALDYFMAHRQRTPITVDAEIHLRPHPSDPSGKYDAWLARQSNPRVSLDRSATLADALAWSNVVVGCQTYAMVLALACGRTVISANPPWAPPCVLPQPEIICLSDLRNDSF
jgi:hypothetical protein